MEKDKPNAAEEGLDTGTPLSPALLAKVLQHVDPKQRLDACARVSTAWHAAAALSTRRIDLPACTQRKCSALQPWLATKAQAVEAVSIAARYDSRILAADAWINTPESTWRMPELLLPYHTLSNLTSLSLKLLKCPLTAAAAAAAGAGTVSTQQGSFPPPAGSSSSNTKAQTANLAALTTLRELSVIDCVISLEGLPALTALERLELLQGWCAPHGSHRVPPAGAAAAAGKACTASAVAEGISALCGDIAGAALPHLTRLTHLALAGSCCSEAAFLNIHHLESLESLVLGWATLPQPVVAGCEAWSLLGTTLDSGTMPGLGKLTGLRKLVVAGAVEAVDPVLLGGLPAGLQHLQLDDVRLVMTLGQPRLAVLAGFQQLAHLSLNNKRGPLSFLSAEDCVALTASTKLTYLGLTGCQMPADGCSKMFGAEGQLPWLERLEVAPSILSDPAAVALLSICCPQLRECVVQLPSAASQRLVGPVNLSGLQQVAGLRQLVLTGATIAGSSGFRALGQLTGLQELVVSALRGFRLADVMQLTACKDLRYLKLMHMQLTDVLAASLCLSHQGPEDRPANVWAQLPPALLKQALWLYPFRSLPSGEEVTQVSELINALQMHFLVEQSGHNAVAVVQQQVVSLALALLQLQQQRKALSSAAAGGGGGGSGASASAAVLQSHPVLLQLQQQTQVLRDTLMKRIGDLQACIKNPQQLNRLLNNNAPTAATTQHQQTAAVAATAKSSMLPAMTNSNHSHLPVLPQSLGVNAAAALGGSFGGAGMPPGMGGGLSGQQQLQQQLLLQKSLAGIRTGLPPLLQQQQQLQLQQAMLAAQAGPMGGAGFNAALLAQHQQQQQYAAFLAPPVAPGTPVAGGRSSSNSSLGGAGGGNRPAGAGGLHQQQQQQQQQRQQQNQGGLTGHVTPRPTDSSNTAALLALLEQQEHTSRPAAVSAAAAVASDSLLQALAAPQQLSSSLATPPGLGGPPPGLGRSAAAVAASASAAFAPSATAQASQALTQQQLLMQEGDLPASLAQLLAAQQQLVSGPTTAGSLTAGMLAQLYQPHQQQQQQQQASAMFAQDFAAQMLPQQAMLQFELLQQQQQLQAQAQQAAAPHHHNQHQHHHQQQQQQLQHLLQLQALAGVQGGLAGLLL